jgi:hypothetical protein
MLHGLSSVVSPRQGRPPCTGARHDLARSCSPPSHDLLQGDHSPHSPHFPSTETNQAIFSIKTTWPASTKFESNCLVIDWLNAECLWCLADVLACSQKGSHPEIRLVNPFTASCENAMTLSVPGVPASCEKFPHCSQLNFWSTESIFNQFSVFLKTLNALCVCLQYKHPRSIKWVIWSDKPVTLLLLLWSH